MIQTPDVAVAVDDTVLIEVDSMVLTLLSAALFEVW